MVSYQAGRRALIWDHWHDERYRVYMNQLPLDLQPAVANRLLRDDTLTSLGPGVIKLHDTIQQAGPWGPKVTQSEKRDPTVNGTEYTLTGTPELPALGPDNNRSRAVMYNGRERLKKQKRHTGLNRAKVKRSREGTDINRPESYGARTGYVYPRAYAPRQDALPIGRRCCQEGQ